MKKLILISLVLLAVLGISQEWVSRSFGPISWQQPSDWQETPPLAFNSTGVFKGVGDGQTLNQGIGVFFIYDAGVEEALVYGLSQDASLVDQGETEWKGFKGRYYKFEGNNLSFNVQVFPLGMRDLAFWNFVAGEPADEDLKTLEKILSSIDLNDRFKFSRWNSQDGTLKIYQNGNHFEGSFGEKTLEGIVIENSIFGWWKKSDSTGSVGPSRFWDGAFSGKFVEGKLQLLFSSSEDPFYSLEGTTVTFENVSGKFESSTVEEVSVTESLLCRSVYENTPFATDTAFTPFDKRIVMWSATKPFENSHIFKWEWYDPDGNLKETVYYIVAPTIETGYDYYDSVWGWMATDRFGKDALGEWKVVVYADGKKLDESSFKLVQEPEMKTIETETFKLNVPAYTYYQLSEGVHYFILDIANLIFAEAHYETEPLNGEVYKTPNYEVNFIETSMPDYQTGQNFIYWVVQFPEKDGQYLYMSFYAPEDDFKRLESLFERILNSVELK
ncbi:MULTISPECIES: hypothetical protein [unclassified Thermotoga]|uniref:hypothetical protein n=1 Tax=unclassified Thermotoga TaxID=2631113 RepID=UPI000280EB6A|nr:MULTISPECIES: hypothetical protein [unclassified Thermotoga]AIY86465.1 hypothetical protein T2812B_04610 [Thermotoga sp. 2812B]EJX25906.1 hypothetical protein EMP_05246 [Thermotoga sp. EMP]